ncbi:MAG: helix-turn-helix domain-containing protein, partial [Thermodesulfobacteriota bacterium]
MEPLDQNHEATESQEELSLGSLLKKSRNERGIELEEAFRETRIRRQILEALENERWDELSPSTFVKGFLKTYADFLGLDKNTVLELYERSIPIEKGKSESLTQESLGTNRRPLILIVSAVALAFIVSITFLSRKDISIVDKFYQYMGTQEPVAEKKQAPVPEQTKTRDIPDKKEIPSKTMAEEQDLVPEQM